MNTHIEIAEKIIDGYCRKKGFEPKLLHVRKDRNLCKRWGKIALYKHRQILTLYILDNTDVTAKRISHMLGYTSHQSVLYLRDKMRHLFRAGDDEVHDMYEDISSWADQLLEN
jgi:hypothetical protein